MEGSVFFPRQQKDHQQLLPSASLVIVVRVVGRDKGKEYQQTVEMCMMLNIVGLVDLLAL
jgi:hypothetical protein